MSNCIELILEHVRLVQEGKEDEALEVLKKIWQYSDGGKRLPKKEDYKIPTKESIKPKEKPVEKPKKKPSKKLDDLTKLKGIGKKTVEDLKRIFGDYDSLVESLKKGEEVPMRDNIHKILYNNLIK